MSADSFIGWTTRPMETCRHFELDSYAMAAMALETEELWHQFH